MNPTSYFSRCIEESSHVVGKLTTKDLLRQDDGTATVTSNRVRRSPICHAKASPITIPMTNVIMSWVACAKFPPVDRRTCHVIARYVR